MHIHFLFLSLCILVEFFCRLKVEKSFFGRLIFLPQDNAWIVLNTQRNGSHPATESLSSSSGIHSFSTFDHLLCIFYI